VTNTCTEGFSVHSHLLTTWKFNSVEGCQHDSNNEKHTTVQNHDGLPKQLQRLPRP
jgi:hypothetical protein